LTSSEGGSALNTEGKGRKKKRGGVYLPLAAEKKAPQKKKKKHSTYFFAADKKGEKEEKKEAGIFLVRPTPYSCRRGELGQKKEEKEGRNPFSPFCPCRKKRGPVWSNWHFQKKKKKPLGIRLCRTREGKRICSTATGYVLRADRKKRGTGQDLAFSRDRGRVKKGVPLSRPCPALKPQPGKEKKKKRGGEGQAHLASHWGRVKGPRRRGPFHAQDDLAKVQKGEKKEEKGEGEGGEDPLFYFSWGGERKNGPTRRSDPHVVLDEYLRSKKGDPFRGKNQARSSAQCLEIVRWKVEAGRKEGKKGEACFFLAHTFTSGAGRREDEVFRHPAHRDLLREPYEYRWKEEGEKKESDVLRH